MSPHGDSRQKAKKFWLRVWTYSWAYSCDFLVDGLGFRDPRQWLITRVTSLGHHPPAARSKLDCNFRVNFKDPTLWGRLPRNKDATSRVL